MPLKLKLLAGAVSLSTIVGIGYFASNKFLNNKQEEDIDKPKAEPKGININNLIKEKLDYELLNYESDPDKWEKNWQKYKANGKNVFNLKSWRKGDNNLNLTEELKEKCKELSTNTVYENEQEHYDNITKYCGRALSFSEKAGKKNLEVLDTTGTKHKQLWEDKFNKREELVIPLKKLGFKGAPEKGDDIKYVCGVIKEKDNETKEYSADFESFETICTQPNVEVRPS